jgi:Family of unknown function (DUF6525)
MSNATQSATGVQLRHPDLHYFDQLPPTARAALANAAFDWSAGAILNRWKKARHGYKTARDITARVAEWDKIQIARDRKRVWGIKP